MGRGDPDPPHRARLGPVRSPRGEVRTAARRALWCDMSARTRLVVATDGSALSNPGPAGWAWAATAPGGGTPQVWAAGPLGTNTNNVAELTALRELLRAVPASVPLEVRADSQYVINCVTEWIHGWRRRGWKTAAGAPVKNRDLIVEIDALLAGRDVVFRWVKAHQARGGDPLNEFVDEAARAAATSVRAGTTPGPAVLGPGWPASN